MTPWWELDCRRSYGGCGPRTTRPSGRSITVLARSPRGRLSRLTALSGCEGIGGVTGVVEVRDLRRTFESEGVPVRALRGVDLTVARGEFVAVMGPSGCGKSTLLNLIAGLDTPSGGEVRLGGRIARRTRRKRPRADAPPPHRVRVPVLPPARRHERVGQRRARGRRGRDASPGRGDARARATRPARARGARPADSRRRFPVGSGSGSRSRARSPTSRRCCSRTSRPARWTPTAGVRSSSSSAGCTRAARRSCS